MHNHGDQAREMLKGRKIPPPGAPASRRLRSASCRTRIFANEHAIDQQMMPFRQGNFSESSGGGRIVWSWTSFLTHRCGWRTIAWGEGRSRKGDPRPPPTGTLGDRSLVYSSRHVITEARISLWNDPERCCNTSPGV